MKESMIYNLIENSLELDKKDMKILSILQTNPYITYTEIAKSLDMSQPSIGNRINRLKNRGLLKRVYGIDFRNTNLTLAQISIQTPDIRQLIKRINTDIGKLLIWTTTGKYNLNMIICGESIRDIGNMVNMLIKNEKDINLIKFEIIDNLLSQFILPLKV